MNTTGSKRFKTAILASAALLAASVAAPQPAKADATLAAILGGSALLGLILHSNQPIFAPRFQKANSALTHQRYNPAPYQAAAMPSYPSYAPVVYASVGPAPIYGNPYRVIQPVRYQVTAPISMSQRGGGNVYHSSANMRYPMPMGGMQQQQMPPMQQAMAEQQEQPPAQAQQMAYQGYGSNMGMAQPQYGTTYPQY